MPKIFGVGFKILRRNGVRSTRCWRTEASEQAWTSLQQTSLQDFSCPPLFRGGAVAKDLSLGAIIGVVCYQWRRIVAYSAYIFKALGVTLAWGLCGMHPGQEGEGGGGGGSPRKIVWGCAAHFPKPFHFLKAHSFPRATPSENRSLLETDKVIMSADKHSSIPTVIRAKWRLLFISFIYINTCRFKAKNYSSRSHRSKTALPLHLETIWQALGHTVVSKISLLQLTVFEALLSSLREATFLNTPSRSFEVPHFVYKTKKTISCSLTFSSPACAQSSLCTI